VAGDVALDGGLEVTLLGGYQPTGTEQLTIVRHAARTGEFATIEWSGNATGSVAYEAGQIVLGAMSATSGGGSSSGGSGSGGGGGSGGASCSARPGARGGRGVELLALTALLTALGLRRRRARAGA
jgi:hypothetical protein